MHTFEYLFCIYVNRRMVCERNRILSMPAELGLFAVKSLFTSQSVLLKIDWLLLQFSFIFFLFFFLYSRPPYLSCELNNMPIGIAR
ncbi:hypothetical protein BDZ91DRAFT_712244 [Kalaharituber pfeilii]|nr:hypothetical protein BDZ91DRAFT_712244 [Kalaharituber pfeilii]